MAGKWKITIQEELRSEKEGNTKRNEGRMGIKEKIWKNHLKPFLTIKQYQILRFLFRKLNCTIFIQNRSRWVQASLRNPNLHSFLQILPKILARFLSNTALLAVRDAVQRRLEVAESTYFNKRENDEDYDFYYRIANFEIPLKCS